jgi:triphosphatase
VIGQLGALEYRSLMLDLSALVEIEAWAGDRFRGNIARQPILDLASRTLERQWRRIHTIHGRVERLGSRQLHRLRIWAKTFRYTCDFFGGAFVKPKAGKRYRRFIARLGELQDALGTLNDLTTNRKLTKKFATHSGRHDGKRGRRAKADLLSAAARIHAAMLKMKPFW